MKRSPLKRKTPLQSRTGLKQTSSLARSSGLSSGSSLRPRSEKRQRLYEDERIPLVKELLAVRPWCEACPVFAAWEGLVSYRRRPSVDVHEVLSRGRGGSITDRDNCITVCRECHDRITFKDVELAVHLGLARHSWDAGEGSSGVDRGPGGDGGGVLGDGGPADG